MIWLIFKRKKDINSRIVLSNRNRKLTIRRIEKYDIGKYKWIVENDAGSDKKEFDVDVVIKPSVKAGFVILCAKTFYFRWLKLLHYQASNEHSNSYFSSVMNNHLKCNHFLSDWMTKTGESLISPHMKSVLLMINLNLIVNQLVTRFLTSHGHWILSQSNPILLMEFLFATMVKHWSFRTWLRIGMAKSPAEQSTQLAKKNF